MTCARLPLFLSEAAGCAPPGVELNPFNPAHRQNFGAGFATL